MKCATHDLRNNAASWAVTDLLAGVKNAGYPKVVVNMEGTPKMPRPRHIQAHKIRSSNPVSWIRLTLMAAVGISKESAGRFREFEKQA